MLNTNDQFNEMKKYTAKNTAISPNFLVWKFCGKAQFPHSLKSKSENSTFCPVCSTQFSMMYHTPPTHSMIYYSPPTQSAVNSLVPCITLNLHQQHD